MAPTISVAVFSILIGLGTKFLIHLITSRLPLRHVPGPKPPSLIWGEEARLFYTSPGSHYLGWQRQFGKVVKLSGAFGHPILCITDPRAISYILGAQGAYDKFPKPQGVQRMVQKDACPQSVRHFTSIFYETSSKLVAQWNKLLDNDNMDELEIEVTDWAGRFALETVARAAFSYDFNLLSGEPDPLLEALDGLTNNEHNATSFYMRALFWIFPAILSLGKKGEMVRKTKTELGDLARRMWREAKVANDSHETTLMALMLKADTDSEQRMDEEEVVAQMRTILSAGYETVSATIAWTLYELALNPDIQAKLRAEVTCAPGDPTLDELTSKFPILNAVLLETLRLHPPILENHHQADETISVPLSEPIGTSEHRLVIPKGTILFIPVNVIQTDPDIWGVNADSFRIERWLQPGPKPSLLAFSEGPRSCIGKRFAVAEIKALVLTVIRHFSVSCKHDIEPFQSFVVRPRVKGTPMSSLPLIVKRL
ncbi:Cytochrome P450 [Mycena kentingensis (nom. inval.)]|nr:Cytochrome P450 [Mycena kentingensis (nom. inval.)]